MKERITTEKERKYEEVIYIYIVRDRVQFRQFPKKEIIIIVDSKNFFRIQNRVTFVSIFEHFPILHTLM